MMADKSAIVCSIFVLLYGDGQIRQHPTVTCGISDFGQKLGQIGTKWDKSGFY